MRLGIEQAALILGCDTVAEAIDLAERVGADIEAINAADLCRMAKLLDEDFDEDEDE